MQRMDQLAFICTIHRTDGFYPILWHIDNDSLIIDVPFHQKNEDVCIHLNNRFIMSFAVPKRCKERGCCCKSGMASIPMDTLAYYYNLQLQPHQGDAS